MLADYFSMLMLGRVIWMWICLWAVDFVTTQSTPASRICIVTRHIAGPIKGGGLATAHAALAFGLANSGNHNVDVLYLPGYAVFEESFDYWKERFQSMRVNLIPAPQEEHLEAKGIRFHESTHPKLVKSYIVYWWLRNHERSYDVVIFHDFDSPAYYTLASKNAGFAFQHITFLTIVHSPTVFLHDAGSQYLYTTNHTLTAFLERVSVSQADHAIFPSQFLLSWVKQDGWTLPATSVLQNLLLDSNSEKSASVQDNTHNEFKELVFFGNLLEIKGLSILSSALAKLGQTMDLAGLSVTLLGHANNGADILERFKLECQCEATWIGHFNTSEAVNYLSRSGTLAVMPSIQDNSPSVVLECLMHGIPFIASSVGGIPELIHPDSHGVLFSPSVQSLASKLELVLTKGIHIAQPAFSAVERLDQWKALIQTATAQHRESFEIPVPSDETQRERVCLIHTCSSGERILNSAREWLEWLRNYGEIDSKGVAVGSCATQESDIEVQGVGSCADAYASCISGLPPDATVLVVRSEIKLSRTSFNLLKVSRRKLFFSGSDVGVVGGWCDVGAGLNRRRRLGALDELALSYATFEPAVWPCLSVLEWRVQSLSKALKSVGAIDGLSDEGVTEHQLLFAHLLGNGISRLLPEILFSELDSSSATNVTDTFPTDLALGGALIDWYRGEKLIHANISHMRQYPVHSERCAEICVVIDGSVTKHTLSLISTLHKADHHITALVIQRIAVSDNQLTTLRRFGSQVIVLSRSVVSSSAVPNSHLDAVKWLVDNDRFNVVILSGDVKLQALAFQTMQESGFAFRSVQFLRFEPMMDNELINSPQHFVLHRALQRWQTATDQQEHPIHLFRNSAEVAQYLQQDVPTIVKSPPHLSSQIVLLFVTISEVSIESDHFGAVSNAIKEAEAALHVECKTCSSQVFLVSCLIDTDSPDETSLGEVDPAWTIVSNHAECAAHPDSSHCQCQESVHSLKQYSLTIAAAMGDTGTYALFTDAHTLLWPAALTNGLRMSHGLGADLLLSCTTTSHVPGVWKLPHQSTAPTTCPIFPPDPALGLDAGIMFQGGAMLWKTSALRQTVRTLEALGLWDKGTFWRSAPEAQMITQAMVIGLQCHMAPIILAHRVTRPPSQTQEYHDSYVFRKHWIKILASAQAAGLEHAYEVAVSTNP